MRIRWFLRTMLEAAERLKVVADWTLDLRDSVAELRQHARDEAGRRHTEEFHAILDGAVERDAARADDRYRLARARLRRRTPWHSPSSLR